MKEWKERGRKVNHAGHAFTGRTTELAKFWINKNNPNISYEWCLHQIQRQKSKRKQFSRLKYGNKTW